MRSILAATLAVGLMGCTGFRAPSHQALAAELAGKTVALVETRLVDDETGEVSDHVYCSGVWVSPRLILTAAHCVEDVDLGDPVQYSTLNDISEFPTTEYVLPHPAHVVDVDAYHDLALIHADLALPAHAVAELSHADIAAGQPAFAMGAPLGLVWSFSSGEVAAVRYSSDGDHGLWYVQATTPISPGSSGGGLWDERGRLIGITRAYLRGGENLNLFVHRDYIAAFLAGDV